MTADLRALYLRDADDQAVLCLLTRKRAAAPYERARLAADALTARLKFRVTYRAPGLPRPAVRRRRAHRLEVALAAVPLRPKGRIAHRVEHDVLPPGYSYWS